MAYDTVKIEAFLPEEAIAPIREALHAAGAGRIGNYDHCGSVYQVTGFWRPLEGAQPYQGEIGVLYEGAQYKLELRCPLDRAGDAVRAIRRHHPYEEPVINVIPLLTLD